MKHNIIVKWTKEGKKREGLLKELEELFSATAEVEGVKGVQFIPNCVDRPNRYDLMIVIEMEKDALPCWDASSVHHEWKDRYGSLVTSKAIFDCE